MHGKIGAFTHTELLGQVRALASRTRGASRSGAEALLPEVHAFIGSLHEELKRDHAELTRERQQAAGASAEIEAGFAQSDAAREALQARQMEELYQRLEQAREQRSEQSLWTRMTTTDHASKAIQREIAALEEEHDAQDLQDHSARQVLVSEALAPLRPYEQEVQATQSVLDEAQELVNMLLNLAAGWGSGSDTFRRIERIVTFAHRANAYDLDARAFMAVTAALTGRDIDELNGLHSQLRSSNGHLNYRHKLTDVEALATLACAAAAANMQASQILDLWCEAVDHAYRIGGFSNDEDARAMVVLCAALTSRYVGDVQTERRAINVENFRGQDPEGAGMILLTHTLSRRPVHELVSVYHSAGRAGLPMEERGYMAMAAGLGDKGPDWAVSRFRSLQALVGERVSLPYSWEDRRDALREAAATLTIAAAISPWRDDQLVELYEMTKSFRPPMGKADYEARGGLVIGAVAPACKL
jgi:hypothetical protein